MKVNPWIYIIVGVFGVAIFTILAGYGWLKLKQESEPLRGKISGKILDETKPYILNFGNNFREFNGNILKQGINLAKLSVVYIEGVNIPIKLYSENNRLLIDATIYDKNNTIIGQIIRNEWEIIRGNIRDRNYSINAFEIIDNENKPVLQIYLGEGNNIFFGGYFYNANEKKYYYSTEGITYIESPMKTIFKYPSSKYLGKLNDPDNLPKFPKN